MNQGESIIISAEALKTLRETRYNPGRNITATRLANMLEAFDYGDIRECAMLWEQIAERDDTVKCVKPKREKSVSGLIPVYEPAKRSGALGVEQAEVLEKFWGRVRATNAYDRNVSGGLRLLIQQWMTAVSFRYAVHHIVWSPRRDGLSATFEYVPLWLFENKTGKLRFLRNPFNVYGENMEPGEWLVTAGEGLMIAVSIGWLAKRDTYNDWLIFSSRFSTPGILGRTRAAQDSPEGRAMKQAVMAFGRELKAVCYGDDGTIKDPIQIIQADGTPTGQPMPSLIERIDRKFSALYRGNDLGTMSAGSGEGSGASLQGEETDILLEDDIAMCEEKLAEVSRMVLEWHYGSDVEVLAAVKLKPRSEVQSDESAVSSVKTDRTRGVEKTIVRTEAANADEVPSDQSAVNSDDGMETLRELMNAGFADVAELIYKALEATGAERERLLQEAMALLPDKVGDDTLDDAVTELLTKAFLGEDEEVENGDYKGHPFRGNQWRNNNGRSWRKADRPKGKGAPEKPREVQSIHEVIESAFTNPDSNDYVKVQKLSDKDSEDIATRTGVTKNLAGTERHVKANSVMHTMIQHGEDGIPVTEKDIEEVVDHLVNPLTQVWQTAKNKSPRLRSVVRLDRGDLVIVEEELAKDNVLSLVSMHFRQKKSPES